MQQVQEQPWVPAGLAAKLVKGARVRVRLSGECPGDQRDGDTRRINDMHPRAVDGTTGYIKNPQCLHPQERDDTHPYLVLFDHDIDVGSGNSLYGGHFAAAELILLAEVQS